MNNLQIRVAPVGTPLSQPSDWITLPMPDYNGYQVELYDVDAPTTGRDQNGIMHRDRVAVKRKVIMTWSNLAPEVVDVLLGNTPMMSVFFDMRYWDPINNGYRTGTFYVGDRSVPLLSTRLSGKGGTLGGMVGQVSFSFIER